MVRPSAAPFALVAVVLLGAVCVAPGVVRGPSAARLAVPIPTESPPEPPTVTSTPARSPSPARSVAAAARQPKARGRSGWQRPAAIARPTSTVSASGPGGGVTAIGDSVMVDATPNLRALIPGIVVDAVTGRQAASGVAAMQALASSGRLRASVVIALGTNGAFSGAQLNRLLTLAAGRHVVVLTNHCPYCAWVPANNRMIESVCTLVRACTVADWHSLALTNRGWFGSDGVHMPIGETGGQAYAELVARNLTPPPACLRGSPVGATPFGGAAWRCTDPGD